MGCGHGQIFNCVLQYKKQRIHRYPVFERVCDLNYVTSKLRDKTKLQNGKME